MQIIYRKELRSHFTTLPGYIFIALLLGFGGFYLTVFNLRSLWPGLEDTYASMSYIFLLIVPLLTMKSVTEERTHRTDKLLATLPLSPWSVVVGKYASLLTILAIPAAIIALYPLILSLFGSVHLPTAYVGLLSFFLLSATLLAVGMFISALTDNQVSAAVACFGVLLLIYFIHPLSRLLPVGAWVNFLVISVLLALLALMLYRRLRNVNIVLGSYGVAQLALFALLMASPDTMETALLSVARAIDVTGRMLSFTHGLLDLTAVVYFVGVTALMLVLTTMALRPVRAKAQVTQTATAALVLLAVVLANMVAGALPQTITRPDLSGGRFTLSPVTHELLDRVEDYPITIYYVATPGDENPQILDFIGRYTARSNITMNRLDPLHHPVFVREHFGDAFSGAGLVVSSHRRALGLDANAFWRFRIYSGGAFMGYIDSREEFHSAVLANAAHFGSGAMTFEEFFLAERQITSAVDFVTTDILPIVYTLTGHGSETLDPILAGYVAENNIDLRTLALHGQPNVPAHADAVIIKNPTADISATELASLRDFAVRGGNLIFISDSGAGGFPNLMELMAHFGLSANDEGGGIVFESVGNYHQHPRFIFPQVNTAPLHLHGNPVVYAPNSGSIIVTETAGVNVIPLLTTSENAHIEGQEERGVHYLAIFALRDNVAMPNSRLVWIATPQLIDFNVRSNWSGNTAFFLSVMNTITDRPPSVSVAAADVTVSLLNITTATANFLTATFVALLPVIFLTVGGTIYILRRRR